MMNWIKKKYEEYRIRYILWSEDRKRGGAESRKALRLERRNDTRFIKESLYLDLQQGWLIGDFRMLPEHVETVGRWANEPLSTIVEIHRYYRGWQNEEVR
jgi:hypothetical protein